MRPIFIGDEVTAAAYRLAGADVRIPAAGNELASVRDAMAESPPLVLVSASLVARWSPSQRVEILGTITPPVLPVGDTTGDGDGIDLVGWLRSRIIA